MPVFFRNSGLTDQLMAGFPYSRLDLRKHILPYGNSARVAWAGRCDGAMFAPASRLIDRLRSNRVSPLSTKRNLNSTFYTMSGGCVKNYLGPMGVFLL